MSEYDNFKPEKTAYINKLKTTLQGLHIGDCIAFIKNKRKHVLRITNIVLSTAANAEDAKIEAQGVVWQGGWFSIDAITIATVNGINTSAGGYRSNTGTARGWLIHPNPSGDEASWPQSEKGVGIGTLEDEFASVNYIAYYSANYPIVIDKLVHTNTATFTDDVLEFCVIDPAVYEWVLNMMNFRYTWTTSGGSTKTAPVTRYHMMP